MPVLLRDGLRLLENIEPVELEKSAVQEVGVRTSLRFRVVRSSDSREASMSVDLLAARSFMAGHGRLLDGRRFELLFGDGDAELVLAALRAQSRARRCRCASSTRERSTRV